MNHGKKWILFTMRMEQLASIKRKHTFSAKNYRMVRRMMLLSCQIYPCWAQRLRANMQLGMKIVFFFFQSQVIVIWINKYFFFPVLDFCDWPWLVLWISWRSNHSLKCPLDNFCGAMKIHCWNLLKMLFQKNKSYHTKNLAFCTERTAHHR